MKGTVRTGLVAAAFAAATLAGTIGSASAQGTLRIGMTAADIPLSFGQPDNGFEGYRFMGLMVYDALINWDLTSADKASGLTPALAESWAIDPNDHTKWIFKLRHGVKFHDGSPFNADAVVFNYEKMFDQKSPQYSARQASLAAFRAPGFKSVRKIDDYTVEFTTKAPDAFWPYEATYILIASPAQWEKTGKDWNKFGLEPSGTGPWKMTKLVPHERAEFVPNKDYWDKAHRPKLDKVVTLPIPDPNTRTSALLSGQVDWIEAPAPDAIAQLKSQGFAIASNVYPHIWSWTLSRVEGSPWNDVRVRKAANLAIDRKGIVELLDGYAAPAAGHVAKSSPWFGNPAFKIEYSPDKAKALMKEAGFGPDHPIKTTVLISASGSGQMLPVAMNEYMQQNLKDIGIDVSFEVVEWQALLDLWRAGAKAPQVKGATAINISYATQDPFSAFSRFLRSDYAAPNGVNWGYYNDPAMDKLLHASEEEFDPKKQEAVLAKIHTKMVDDALFLWVVHDVAPRAMSTKVKGFVQAQNWFQSLNSVYMAK